MERNAHVHACAGEGVGAALRVCMCCCSEWSCGGRWVFGVCLLRVGRNLSAENPAPADTCVVSGWLVAGETETVTVIVIVIVIVIETVDRVRDRDRDRDS